VCHWTPYGAHDVSTVHELFSLNLSFRQRKPSVDVYMVPHFDLHCVSRGRVLRRVVHSHHAIHRLHRGTYGELHGGQEETCEICVRVCSQYNQGVA
jgi:hypothetical protein